MIDAKHPFVPFGGETENGFRKFCAQHSGEGLKCSSAGTGPAQVAVAIKTAIAALEGKVVPQSVKLPLAIVEDPNFKDGETTSPTSPTTSSSATPSRPAASTSPRRKSWARRKKTSNLGLNSPSRRVEQIPRRRLSFRIMTGRRPMVAAAPLFRMEGVSKRYGGVRALEKAELDRRWPGASTASWARTAPASPPSIKIMAGVVAPDEGRMTHGRP